MTTPKENEYIPIFWDTGYKAIRRAEGIQPKGWYVDSQYGYEIQGPFDSEYIAFQYLLTYILFHPAEDFKSGKPSLILWEDGI